MKNCAARLARQNAPPQSSRSATVAAPPRTWASPPSKPAKSQSHPVPSIKPEIGRSVGRLRGIYFGGEPHPSTLLLATPQFRGTNKATKRPYHIVLEKEGRGGGGRGVEGGPPRPIAIYLIWKRDVKQVSTLSILTNRPRCKTGQTPHDMKYVRSASAKVHNSKYHCVTCETQDSLVLAGKSSK